MSRMNEILINEYNAFYGDIKDIIPYIQNKEGFIQNASFKEHTDYTTDEWMAIFAQYSISYNWSTKFYEIFGVSAEELATTIPNILKDTKSRVELPIGLTKKEFQVIVNNLLFSKTPITPVQHELLSLVPLEFLSQDNIIIKDTWMMVVKRFGSKAKFNNSKDIYRYCENVEKFKTSEKKFVIRALEKLGVEKCLEDMNPLKKEWMRIFKKLRYTNDATLVKKHPTYFSLVDNVYNDKFKDTMLSKFERFLKEKEYVQATRLLSQKPGMFYRRILDLGRYTTLLPVIMNTADKVNTKTLIQLVFLLKHTDRDIYSKEQIIEYLIENLKDKVPHNIGIDSLDLMTRALSFSDKEDENETMSGEFITFGSKLKVNSRYVRVGVAWRGPTSIDLDQHVDTQYGDLYFGNPMLKNEDGKLIGLSSGDITENRKDIFSVELVDIDTRHIKEFEYRVNSFRNDPINENEVYIFIKGIKQFDESIKDSRNITIDLNDTNHAIKVNNMTKRITSLKYNNGYIQVLNRPTSEKLEQQLDNVVLVKDLVDLLDIETYTTENTVTSISELKELVFK